MIRRILSFTLALATASPSTLLMLELKKYLSSKIPWGVWAYLFVVTRLTVDGTAVPLQRFMIFAEHGVHVPYEVVHHGLVVSVIEDGSKGVVFAVCIVAVAQWRLGTGRTHHGCFEWLF